MKRSTPAEKAHPAQFNEQVLRVLESSLTKWGVHVHDPFAGPGVRLATLCDSLGLSYTGTEIEREFIVDRRVRNGDSTRARTYPRLELDEWCVATSPAYPNGVSDHFKAGTDTVRHTYRQAVADIRGEDRPLSDNNMGRWSLRSGQKSLHRHMEIAAASIRHWPDRCLVNVSDFIVAGEVHGYVNAWRRLLKANGYSVTQRKVETPRLAHGENYQARVNAEAVLVAVRFHRDDREAA